jgi:HTH domain found in ParB protein
MTAVAPSSSAVRAVSGHVLGTTRLCAAPGCPNEAETAGELCTACARRTVAQPAQALPLNDALGLQFDPRLGLEVWHATLQRAARLRSAFNWILGDLLAGSELATETKLELAEQETGLPPATLKVLEWVARSVSRERRIGGLAWAHHKTVASLDPEKQAELLALCLRERWTVRRLEEEVRSAKGTLPLGVLREPDLEPDASARPASSHPPRPTVTVHLRRDRIDVWRVEAERRGWTIVELVEQAVERFLASL